MLLLLTIVCLSCEKKPVQPNENDGTETESINSSLQGVWLMKEHNEKALFFISFHPTSSTEGKYSLCVSTSIMSSGTYTISSNSVNLTNYIGYSCGNLTVNLSNGCLTVYGNVISYDTQDDEYFSEDFTLSNEEISFPVVGITYTYGCLSVIYGSSNQYLTLTSNYILRIYSQQDHGSHTIFNDYTYYYVYRNKNNQNPIVYTQGTDGYGEIDIYQLIDFTEIIP